MESTIGMVDFSRDSIVALWKKAEGHLVSCTLNVCLCTQFISPRRHM